MRPFVWPTALHTHVSIQSFVPPRRHLLLRIRVAAAFAVREPQGFHPPSVFLCPALPTASELMWVFTNGVWENFPRTDRKLYSRAVRDMQLPQDDHPATSLFYCPQERSLGNCTVVYHGICSYRSVGLGLVCVVLLAILLSRAVVVLQADGAESRCLKWVRVLRTVDTEPAQNARLHPLHPMRWCSVLLSKSTTNMSKSPMGTATISTEKRQQSFL